MFIFSGTANQKLTEEVTRILGLTIAKSEVIRFGNSEVRVRICQDVENETAVVIQTTANPTDTNLMELFFYCDALKRSEVKKVVGIIPYFGYARQNVQHRPGECVSANVIIRFLETIGFHKIYTIDLHDQATEGVFSIPFKHLSASRLLAEMVKKFLGKQDVKNISIVSPDQGGIERSRNFSENFFGIKGLDIGVIEKKRNLNKIHESGDIELFGDVKGKDVILVDDIITSGGTLINAAELCLKKGAKSVIAAITHHDFSEKAPAKLQNSVIEKIFTTNTITLKEEQKFPKLVEVSVAPFIAQELNSLIR